MKITSQQLSDVQLVPGPGDDDPNPYQCQSGTPPPGTLPVSEQHFVCLEKVIHNNGPDPVKVEITKEVDAPDPGDGPILCDNDGPPQVEFDGVFVGTNAGGGDVGSDIDPGNLANALLALGQVENAIQHYRTAIQLKPDYARAHYNLGSALTLRGDLDEAAEHFRTALRLDPDWPEPRRALESIREAQPTQVE